MDVNYLAYADAVGRNNANADGLKSLRETLEKQSELARLAPQEAQTAKLRDMQIKQAQITIDDAVAKQGALSSIGGTLQGGYEQQMRREQEQKQTEAKQKGLETYLNTLKALDGMSNLDPKVKTDIGKHFLSQNPEYAPIAANLTFVDSQKVKAARQFGDGELKDPTTGQVLPAGYYETEGEWTGDASQPVKLTSYKLVPEKPDQEALIDKRFANQQKLQAEQIAAQDRRTAQQIAAADRRAAKSGTRDTMQGGKPTGGKILPAGQLESIADMKRVKDVLAEASDLLKGGGIDTGPVSGRLQSLGAKVGLASDNFVNLQQKMQTAENIMLKLRSGAAVTESEYQRFKKEFPRTSDTPEVRDRKMSNAIQYASTLMDSKMDIYEEGGYRVPQSVKSGNKPAQKRNAQPKQGQTKKGGRFTIIEVK